MCKRIIDMCNLQNMQSSIENIVMITIKYLQNNKILALLNPSGVDMVWFICLAA